MILRVFPSRTNATPIDELTRFVEPGLFDPPTCDEVHISVTFTWDKRRGDDLHAAWSQVHDRVRIGGPAYGDRGGEFTPGRYLRHGHVITSRGCPGRCWFCDVWKREGTIRELPICDGWKVQDSNLLACSRKHIETVFDMLKRQPHRPEFLGGLEAARLQEWHVERLRDLKPRRLFCAYDTVDDLVPLQRAGDLMCDITDKHAYVLIGFDTDTFSNAEVRLRQAHASGFLPYAMLWRDNHGQTDRAWRQFQREWVRPAIVRAKLGKGNQAAKRLRQEVLAL